jgi:hypothetical protein
LDLQQPKTYIEKLHWLNLFELLPIKVILSEKHKVKEWVASKIGIEHVVPLIGVWSNPEDIDFDSLPDRFVFKAVNGACGKQMIIVKNKDELNIKKVKRVLANWMSLNYVFAGSAGYLVKFIYSSIPRIIAEEYIENIGLEYRFYCFDGEPRFLSIDKDILTIHKASLFDLDLKLIPFAYKGVFPLDFVPTKPKYFDKMVEMVRVLCAGFSHVRVDMYYVDDKIYFGEMTFTPGEGVSFIKPYKYEYILGEMIRLPKDIR